MSNCLMLDIDGILNNLSTDRYGSYTNQDIQQMYNVLENTKLAPNQIWAEHIFELENDNLNTLRILIKKYSIDHITLCSTWRHAFPLVAIRLLFILKGYPDIAKLIETSTGVVTKEDMDKYGFKRMKVAEIAHAIPDIHTTLAIVGEKVSNWYVLDDDVTVEDLSNIKDYNVSSLYFEFKSMLKEYKAKEQLLINNLAFDRPYDILPYEEETKEENEHYKEIMDRVKFRLRNIKDLILDPKISLGKLVSEVFKNAQMAHASDMVLNCMLKCKKEEKDAKAKRNTTRKSS